jgi:hypothetical protein
MARARFQYQGSLCGICDEQSGNSHHHHHHHHFISTGLLQTCQFSAANCHYTNVPVHVRSPIIHTTSSSALISIIADYTTHKPEPKFVAIPNTLNSYYTILSKTLKIKIRKNHSSLMLQVLFSTLERTYPNLKLYCEYKFKYWTMWRFYQLSPYSSNVEIHSAVHSAVPDPASSSNRHID